ncbi:triose-phosphate isomerase family protein [Propionicicella superfundia]|uniref:triose-phosphate isomerase family protein n=1 Tax=Propionicicella superfundia TaxID=348582 RepID=UPI0004145D3F|nr:triose-phosphate isomerase family protein [Propionicicella superfundia]
MLPKQLIGCSSKSYFSLADARRWAEVARPRILEDGGDGVYLCVPYPLVPLFTDAFAGTAAEVGVQDVSQYGFGAYTGEVSAGLLAEMGVRYVMLGHPERKRYLRETDQMIAKKTMQAVNAGIVPVLIVGEPSPDDDSRPIIQHQCESALGGLPSGAEVLIAYEPVWAIGQPEPAPPSHIVRVVSILRDVLSRFDADTRIVYGGSAAVGTFSDIAAAADDPAGVPDGIFLGRSGLDPHGFLATLAEVRAATSSAAASSAATSS